ncbi:superoxide dismutase [Cu-Zn] SodC [Benzoatithermus flavus]|uniref:Superoxide dismutase [Cu-Zn] n=1 Tax=Benzoatithermus flavus TaxID=3108223 RepID=A0ABU8XMF3_9PROT
MRKLIATILTGGALIATAQAEELKAVVHQITDRGVGDAIGSVAIVQTDAGARFVTDLRGLPSGEHGFHIHEKGDCGPAPNTEGRMAAGMAAGGHWDPEGRKAHMGPEGRGHMGDLPVLSVQADGSAKGDALAPRIKDVAALKGKALMIHAGGDNYSDQPKPLGGGGARIACGVIE